MILHQFYLNCLAHASYLDRRRAVAASPPSSIRSATSSSTWRSPREHGLRIAHVILTHLHADFIAGHLELRDRVGARDLSRRRGQGGVRVHAARATAIAIELGRVRLQALETPGHTPESISIAVFDLDRSDDRAACGADRRHAVCRRRRPPRSARRARLVGGRSRRRCSTTRCAPSCWRCRTPAWSTPRTAPARCAARRSARRRSRRSASSAARTTRCSR